jgi:hypothetical protein
LVEFKKVLNECRKVKYGPEGTLKSISFEFPHGCDECNSGNPLDCIRDNYICPWRENYWKYDELRRILHLEMMLRGGFDLNRLDDFLTDLDFVKIAIMKDFTTWD